MYFLSIYKIQLTNLTNRITKSEPHVHLSEGLHVLCCCKLKFSFYVRVFAVHFNSLSIKVNSVYVVFL